MTTFILLLFFGGIQIYIIYLIIKAIKKYLNRKD